ncbi:MAG: transcription termination factor Rho [Chloroflexi bacterium]|nr:transcription termination factor Rho [Chloroflexota bacterium]
MQSGGNQLTTQSQTRSRRRRSSHRGRRSNGRGRGAPTGLPQDVQYDDGGSQLGDVGAMSTDDLRSRALEIGLRNGIPRKRSDLVLQILARHAEEADQLLGMGILEISGDGHGFLRPPTGSATDTDTEVYVSQAQVRRFGLRPGDQVAGEVRAPKEGERYYALIRVEVVNGRDPESTRNRRKFESLTPIFPDELMKLETTPKNLATRLIDLVAPIGKGQRGLIVAPPKAGKTILLKQIAEGITANNPDVSLIVALVGERPEEVTDMRRSIEGEVYSSTFDEPPSDHTHAAEAALARAKRLVEAGEDVVILVDSLTRLARAYNLSVPGSGKTLSGGMDPVALYPPKGFFGAARNCDEGGSLTILATCLIDTGSRLDDLIYEEFKGTGNMELHLSRVLAERRVYPAIDIQRSGTRHEELLLSEQDLRQIWLLRRMVSIIASDSGGDNTVGTERVIERMSKTQNNEEFLAAINKVG